MKELKSKCCQAKMLVATADEGTSCYICSDCHRPCDWIDNDLEIKNTKNNSQCNDCYDGDHCEGKVKGCQCLCQFSTLIENCIENLKCPCHSANQTFKEFQDGEIKNFHDKFVEPIEKQMRAMDLNGEPQVMASEKEAIEWLLAHDERLLTTILASLESVENSRESRHLLKEWILSLK